MDKRWKSSDLSNIFHCRKRSKYMLSWYCTKGSPLRYLCRSLDKGVTCHSPSTAAWQWDRCADSLSAVLEDVLAGVELQPVPAAWFVLDHGGDAHFRLRKQRRRAEESLKLQLLSKSSWLFICCALAFYCTTETCFNVNGRKLNSIEFYLYSPKSHPQTSQKESTGPPEQARKLKLKYN